MGLFDDLFKGTRFERSYENLTKSAESLERLANQVEQGVEAVLGALDAIETYLDEVVDNLRTSAEQLRAEAQTKTDGVYDKVAPQVNVQSTKTREEKLEHIRARLAAAGITQGSKWLDSEYTNSVPDVVIDTTYRVFGGK